MRVAVVGVSSQIGMPLLQQLALAGYAFYRVGRENKVDEGGAITYVFDESTCCFRPELECVDAVISLAPLPTIEVVLKIARSLRAKRIIAFGSMGRFSKIDSTSEIEQDFVVQHVHAENFLSSKSEALSIGWTLFRPTMIYGADVDQNVTFIRFIVKKFGFFPLPIGANGLRQPVHVNDLATACVQALGCQNTINRVYDLGGGEVLTYPELVKRIFKAEGKVPILIYIPKVIFLLIVKVAQKFPKFAFIRQQMLDRMYQDLTADNQAAKADFGYAPRVFCLTRNVLK